MWAHRCPPITTRRRRGRGRPRGSRPRRRAEGRASVACAAPQVLPLRESRVRAARRTPPRLPRGDARSRWRTRRRSAYRAGLGRCTWRARAGRGTPTRWCRGIPPTLALTKPWILRGGRLLTPWMPRFLGGLPRGSRARAAVVRPRPSWTRSGRTRRTLTSSTSGTRTRLTSRPTRGTIGRFDKESPRSFIPDPTLDRILIGTSVYFK